MVVLSVIISVLLAVAFVAAAIGRKGGVPESISAMVYLFEGSARWLWTIWLWLVSFLMAPALMEALPDEWRFLGFLTLVCLLMTGAMPIFMKEKRKAHYAMGIAAGVLSQLCVLAICPWWLMVWVVMLSALWMKSKAVFISEAICFISLLSCLVIRDY